MTLVTVLVAMLVAAVPAFAQEEVSVTGVLEEQGTKADGTTVYALVDEATGEGYYVETATSEDPAGLIGQRITAYGTVSNEGGRVLTANRIELLSGAQVPEGEEVSATGVVEQGEPKADGAPVYSLVDETSGQGYILEGDFDFAALVGQRVIAYGEYQPGGGAAILNVLNIEPAAEATTTPEETTMGGGTTMAANDQYEDGGGTPEDAGIDLNDDGVVDETDGEFAVQTSDEGVTNTPEEGALPGTGGIVLPLAGLAGALLLVGGLLQNRKSVR